MKRMIAAATLILDMSLGFTVHASAQTSAVRVTVPFDFAVGNHMLPQGTYQIGADGDFLAFKNTDSTTSLFATGLHGDTTHDGRSVLVFDSVQGRYFLRKVVTGWTATSKEWPMSKLEKRAREVPATREIYAENSSR